MGLTDLRVTFCVVDILTTAGERRLASSVKFPIRGFGSSFEGRAGCEGDGSCQKAAEATALSVRSKRAVTKTAAITDTKATRIKVFKVKRFFLVISKITSMI